jgi:hypothetical protein
VGRLPPVTGRSKPGAGLVRFPIVGRSPMLGRLPWPGRLPPLGRLIPPLGRLVPPGPGGRTPPPAPGRFPPPIPEPTSPGAGRVVGLTEPGCNEGRCVLPRLGRVAPGAGRF